MRRLALLIGFTAFGLLACMRGGLPPEKIQAWVGRPATDLVRDWGTPTREVDDAGQRLLVYEEIERSQNREFSREISSSARAAGEVPPAPASSLGYSAYARSYLFWVDATGKIVRTQIREP